MKNKILLSLITLVAVVFLTSCNKAPQPEMDAANAAFTDAKAAGADVYLTAEYTALQDSLNVAMQNIEAKKSKWFASYDANKKQLDNVKLMADQVKEKTETRKNEVKTEVENTITEVTTLLDEDKDLLTKAPKGKEGAAALEQIKNELSVVETTIGEVNALVESGNYMQAQTKINAAKDKASSINTELKDAIAKVHPGKKMKK